jgi:hypothetical protein
MDGLFCISLARNTFARKFLRNSYYNSYIAFLLDKYSETIVIYSFTLYTKMMFSIIKCPKESLVWQDCEFPNWISFSWDGRTKIEFPGRHLGSWYPTERKMDSFRQKSNVTVCFFGFLLEHIFGKSALLKSLCRPSVRLSVSYFSAAMAPRGLKFSTKVYWFSVVNSKFLDLMSVA